MQITVKLFAAARDLAGGESIDVALPQGAKVSDVRKALMERLPAARELLTRSMFAVNCEYARDNVPLEHGAEVACIPPVSGG